MENKTQDKLRFGYYLAAFVDLLGQRERLRKLDALPNDPNGPEYKDFIQIVRNTIGAVHDLQETCKKYFESFTNVKDDTLAHLPGFQKLSRTEIKFQHFSDGLVIYVPLRVDNEYSPMKGVYGALAACGGLCLMGLATQRPVRIGISIGIAGELRNNELYGKAVADAYEAEAYIAQYPRVVVTNEVLNYLGVYANQPCAENDVTCKVESRIAQATMGMLARDYDGRAIVDYLGDFFKENLLNEAGPDLIQRSYKYVQQQLKEFQKNQNTKLAFRYSLLHGYFSDHLGDTKEINES